VARRGVATTRAEGGGGVGIVESDDFEVAVACWEVLAAGPRLLGFLGDGWGWGDETAAGAAGIGVIVSSLDVRASTFWPRMRRSRVMSSTG
jgi:hypothetical protein